MNPRHKFSTAGVLVAAGGADNDAELGATAGRAGLRCYLTYRVVQFAYRSSALASVGRTRMELSGVSR